MSLMAFLPTVIGLCALVVTPTLDEGSGKSVLMYVTSSYAPAIITGLVSASIVAATMSSADSNLLCASTILVKDIYQKFINPTIEDRKIIWTTRFSNISICMIALFISLFSVSIVTMNLFAFALRSAGHFAAYALSLIVPKATKNSGIIYIIVGSISVVVLQLLKEPYGILAIVFGCFCGVISFFIVTFIKTKLRMPSAPSAYVNTQG